MRKISGCLMPLVLIAALVLGAYLFATQVDPAISAAKARRLNAEASRVEVKAQIARDSADAEVAARQFLMLGSSVAAVSLLVGTAVAGVVLLIRRAATIYPNSAGQYPLVRVSGRGWAGVIDPNRSPSNLTIISQGDARPQIAQPMTISEQGHVALAAQASAVAGIVAATRRGDPGRAVDATRTIVNASQIAPLPDVETLQPGHVERLLALNTPADVVDVSEGEFWT